MKVETVSIASYLRSSVGSLFQSNTPDATDQYAPDTAHSTTIGYKNDAQDTVLDTTDKTSFPSTPTAIGISVMRLGVVSDASAN